MGRDREEAFARYRQLVLEELRQPAVPITQHSAAELLDYLSPFQFEALYHVTD